MESERPIEKLLRAFGKKRRDQAGPPLELHAANRRLLQNEIARRSKKPEADGFGFLWSALRARLIPALCLVALGAIVAALILPTLSRSKSKSMQLAQRQKALPTFEETDRKEEPTVPAAPAATPPAQKQSDRNEVQRFDDTKLRDGEKKPLELASADERRSRALQNGEQLAGSAAAVKDQSGNSKNYEYLLAGNALALSKSSTSVVAGESHGFFILTNQVLADADLDAAGGRMGIVRTAAVSGLGSISVTEGEPSQTLSRSPVRFYRIQTETASDRAALDMAQARSRDGNTPVSGVVSNPPLLNSFAVEQNGRQLRLIDNDGSVYNGYLELNTALPGGMAGTLKEDVQSATVPVDKHSSNALVEIAANCLFSVSGTNVSLGKNIVFAGRVWVTNGIQAETATGTDIFNGPRLQPPARTFPQLILSNSRIEGAASIDDSRKIEIQATPAPVGNEK